MSKRYVLDSDNDQQPSDRVAARPGSSVDHAPRRDRQARRTWFTSGWIGPVSLAVWVLAFDQFTKALVALTLGRGGDQRQWQMWDQYLAFRYVENTGAAFGVMPGAGNVLMIFSVAVVIGLVIFFVRTARDDILMSFGLALLIGGAIGNLLDRIRLGYVIDFIAVWWWPTFNIADTAITLGMLTVAWRSIRAERQSATASRIVQKRQGEEASNHAWKPTGPTERQSPPTSTESRP